ncbi:MAG: hypothetical protein CMH58_10345 [Myxococcales bacterium]|nr:hypothetical protein [Myxococcales bacterium]
MKEKIEALEKQKFLNEKNEMLKKTTMESNLNVLKKWLMDYKNALHIKQQKEFYQQLNYPGDEKILKNDIILEINRKKEEIYKKIYNQLKHWSREFQNNILPEKIRNNKDYVNMIKKIINKNMSKRDDYSVRIKYFYKHYDSIIEFIENYNSKLNEEDKKNTWKINNSYDLQTYTSMINNYKQEKLNNSNILHFVDNETINLEYDTFSNLKHILNKFTEILNHSPENISSYSYSINNEPSEIMKQHIEATYNMLNIIDKRLHNIEDKLGFYNM